MFCGLLMLQCLGQRMSLTGRGCGVINNGCSSRTLQQKRAHVFDSWSYIDVSLGADARIKSTIILMLPPINVPID